MKLVPHLAKTEKHNVHSLSCSGLTAQPIQKEKELTAQDLGHPCWLWHITDSLSSCSQSSHLTTYPKMDASSRSIYTWLVDCDATFSPSCLSELHFLIPIFPAVLLCRISQRSWRPALISPSSSLSLPSVWVIRTWTWVERADSLKIYPKICWHSSLQEVGLTSLSLSVDWMQWLASNE